MIISDKHLSICSENSVKNVCSELFTLTEINYFVYHRFYDDGSLLSLPSNAAWHKHFFNQDYHKTTKDRLKTGVHFWAAQDSLSQANQDAKKHFNIDYKFEMVERGQDYFEVFGFATHKDNNKIIDYYLNNASNLKKFGLYFKDKAWKLIEEGVSTKNQRIIITDVYKKAPGSELITPPFIEQINALKSYHLTDEISGDLRLTKKEMECLLLTLMGRTAKEIANACHISEKTAEWYQGCAKVKLNCSSRAELFDKAKKLGILHILEEK